MSLGSEQRRLGPGEGRQEVWFSYTVTVLGLMSRHELNDDPIEPLFENSDEPSDRVPLKCSEL